MYREGQGAVLKVADAALTSSHLMRRKRRKTSGCYQSLNSYLSAGSCDSWPFSVTQHSADVGPDTQ